jgi:hypothetical protein
MSCQEEFLDQSTLDMYTWIARKRQLAAFELQLRSACTGCYPQDNLTQRQLCKCTCHSYKWIAEHHWGVERVEAMGAALAEALIHSYAEAKARLAAMPADMPDAEPEDPR